MSSRQTNEPGSECINALVKTLAKEPGASYAVYLDCKNAASDTYDLATLYLHDAHASGAGMTQAQLTEALGKFSIHEQASEAAAFAELGFVDAVRQLPGVD